MLNFNDKVAIITGGNSGIGEAAAKLFAKQGAAVVLVARRADKLDAVAEELRAAFQAGEMAESEYCRKLKAL